MLGLEAALRAQDVGRPKALSGKEDSENTGKQNDKRMVSRIDDGRRDIPGRGRPGFGALRMKAAPRHKIQEERYVSGGRES